MYKEFIMFYFYSTYKINCSHIFAKKVLRASAMQKVLILFWQKTSNDDAYNTVMDLFSALCA